MPHSKEQCGVTANPLLKFQMTKEVKPSSVKHSMALEFLLISAINSKKSLCPGMLVNWTTGHQKGNNKEETALNNIANEVAGRHHQIRGEWESQPIRRMIPEQKVYLVQNSEQTDNNVDKEVDRHLRGHVTEQYIVNILKMLSETLKLIDWEAIRTSDKSLTI